MNRRIHTDGRCGAKRRSNLCFQILPGWNVFQSASTATALTRCLRSASRQRRRKSRQKTINWLRQETQHSNGSGNSKFAHHGKQNVWTEMICLGFCWHHEISCPSKLWRFQKSCVSRAVRVARGRYSRMINRSSVSNSHVFETHHHHRRMHKSWCKFRVGLYFFAKPTTTRWNTAQQALMMTVCCIRSLSSSYTGTQRDE